jgi:hypothetical protein
VVHTLGVTGTQFAVYVRRHGVYVESSRHFFCD